MGWSQKRDDNEKAWATSNISPCRFRFPIWPFKTGMYSSEKYVYLKFIVNFSPKIQQFLEETGEKNFFVQS
jgi:hypothetical protein